MAAVEYAGPRRRCGPPPRARCAARAVRPSVCRRGVERKGARDGRRPVLAGLAVVVLLVAGGPAADAVAHLGAPAHPATPERGDTATTATTGATEEAPAPATGGQVHVVQPGETYWSIVEDLEAPGDLRRDVDALMAANGGRPLHAGDALVVPAAGHRPGDRP